MRPRSFVAWGLACALAACGKEPAAERPPDVLVFLVDTLRADHLGTYGYERETDPALARFARDAVRFVHAYAPSSWTRPSTASLLTGLPPRRHGAVTGADRLEPAVTLVSERLREAGYRTAAWSGNPNVLPVWGFDQGFETFVDLGAGGAEPRADDFLEALARHRAERETDEPFLYYLHTMEPHHPYDPPDRPGTGARWPFRKERVLKPIQIGPGVTQAALRDTIAAYDGEIAYSDDAFGRLLERLRADGRYDDALIVYVSDHGEEFLDHGHGGHQRTLFEEVVRVPLLVKLPGNRFAGREVEARASLLDVVPTILAAAGLARPPELEGLDLARLAAGDAGALAAADERALFLDLDREGVRGAPNFVAQGVRQGPWKLVRSVSPEPGLALYDLAQDPGETRDVSSEEPELARFLAARLDAEAVAGATGFHLVVENGPDAAPREVVVRLATPGRFASVAGAGLEPGDEATVSADGKELLLRARLENVPNPAHTIPLTLIDVDAVGFALEPAGAPLRVLSTEGASLRLGPARDAGVLPAELADPRAALAASADDLGALRSSDPGLRPRAPRATLLFLAPAEPAPPVDPGLEERLLHLGYGGEDG